MEEIGDVMAVLNKKNLPDALYKRVSPLNCVPQPG
jgi:hypothetical protein